MSASAEQPAIKYLFFGSWIRAFLASSERNLIFKLNSQYLLRKMARESQMILIALLSLKTAWSTFSITVKAAQLFSL